MAMRIEERHEDHFPKLIQATELPCNVERAGKEDNEPSLREIIGEKLQNQGILPEFESAVVAVAFSLPDKLCWG